MRKINALLMCMAFAITMSSCGSNSGTNNKATEDAIAKIQAEANAAIAQARAEANAAIAQARAEADAAIANAEAAAKAAQSSSSTASTHSSNGIPTISSSELVSAFEDNEVAAKKKYTGEIYQITGVIEGFNTSSFADEPVIILKAGGIFSDVRCYFPQSDEDAVAALKKGSKVTVRGRIDDYSLGSVYVKQCNLIK